MKGIFDDSIELPVWVGSCFFARGRSWRGWKRPSFFDSLDRNGGVAQLAFARHPLEGLLPSQQSLWEGRPKAL